MKTITVGNLKGGVGKTTTAINLSCALAEKGYGVLLIDADPISSATEVVSRIDPRRNSIYGLLSDGKDIKNCIYRAKYKNLDVIPSDPGMTESDVLYPSALATQLRCVEDKYDFCIIDTRPSFEMITTAALMASDLLLTPIYLDASCLNNLSLVEDTLSALDDVFTGEWLVFINRYDPRSRLEKQIRREILEKYNYPIADFYVYARSALQSATAMRKSVLRHRSKSDSAADFRDMAEAITEFFNKENLPATLSALCG